LQQIPCQTSERLAGKGFAKSSSVFSKGDFVDNLWKQPLARVCGVKKNE
jgi:hypothetical protein